MKCRYVLPLLLVAVVPLACGVPQSGDLLEGVKWAYSLDAGDTWSADAPIVRGGEVVAFHARARFYAGGGGDLIALAYTHGLPPRQRQVHFLNGRRLRGPVGGMYYKTFPALDPGLLKPGRNELLVRARIDNRPPEGRRVRDMRTIRLGTAALLAQRADDLDFQTPPVLGAAAGDYFTVACRTNMPAQVTLTARPVDPAGKPAGPPVTQLSAGPLTHRFRVAGLPAGASAVAGSLKAVCDGASATATFGPVRLLRPAGRLRMVVMGDSRTNRRPWEAVAAAAFGAKPDLVVFTGDMVARGRNDWEWDEHFISVHPRMFVTIPFFTVLGNHEEGSPVHAQLFQGPAGPGGGNWVQQIGPVLLIGINGRSDWTAGSKRTRWLERMLAEARAKFVFLVSHYPAWSSGKHGMPDEETGRMEDPDFLRARRVIVPLLAKHKATAMLASHAHNYERAELPGGLTHIVSGGAGAPLHKKYDTTGQHNPHSKVFAKAYHYCVLDVDGDTCRFKVVDLNGKVIDSRSWQARKVD